MEPRADAFKADSLDSLVLSAVVFVVKRVGQVNFLSHCPFL